MQARLLGISLIILVIFAGCVPTPLKIAKSEVEDDGLTTLDVGDVADLDAPDSGDPVGDTLDDAEAVPDAEALPEAEVAEVETEADCCAGKVCDPLPGGSCQENLCNPLSCECEEQPLEAGTPCTSDNLLCTDDQCRADGTCGHTVQGGYCLITDGGKKSCVAHGVTQAEDPCLVCAPELDQYGGAATAATSAMTETCAPLPTSARPTAPAPARPSTASATRPTTPAPTWTTATCATASRPAARRRSLARWTRTRWWCAPPTWTPTACATPASPPPASAW